MKKLKEMQISVFFVKATGQFSGDLPAQAEIW